MSGNDDDADGLRIGGWLPDSAGPDGQSSGPATRGAPPPPFIPDAGPDTQPRFKHAVPEGDDTDDVDDVNEPYEGRRRAEEPTGWRRPVVVAAFAGLVVAVTVPLAIAVLSPSEDGVAATASSGGAGSSGGVIVAGTGTWPSSSAVVTTAAPSPGDSRTPPRASRSPSQSPSAKPSPVVFVPVTYEAEAASNSTYGYAWVAAYNGASGGKIVRNIGDWGDQQADGTLTFTGVTVPAAGTYTLTFYYVHIDNASTRTAFITVSGAAPVAVTVVGGSGCCASKAISVSLLAGSNTIVFGNPGGHAPSIDKIVISAG